MTHSLWTGDIPESYAEPSVPSRVTFYAAPKRNDVLVQYDELSPWHNYPHRRVYYARENSHRTQAGKKPKFESLTSTNGLAVIPAYQASTLETNVVYPEPLYALSFTNENRFTIVSTNGTYRGTFELPTYRAAPGTVKAVLLTPVTVALDATIVGGVAGCIVLEGLAQSGASFSWKP